MTVRVAGSMTLIVELRLLLAHTRPFLANAIVRGAIPTGTSPSLAFVAALNTLRLSLSWLTTHSRGVPIAGRSNKRFAEADGAFVDCEHCREVSLCHAGKSPRRAQLPTSDEIDTPIGHGRLVIFHVRSGPAASGYRPGGVVNCGKHKLALNTLC